MSGKLFTRQQAIGSVQLGDSPPTRAEKILPLDLGRGQDATAVEQTGIEQPVFHRKADDTFHVGRTVFIKPRRKVFVKQTVGAYVITLASIDIRKHFHQDAKHCVAFAFHQAADGAVVDKIGIQGKIVQSLFLYSCHTTMIFENYL